MDIRSLLYILSKLGKLDKMTETLLYEMFITPVSCPCLENVRLGRVLREQSSFGKMPKFYELSWDEVVMTGRQ